MVVASACAAHPDCKCAAVAPPACAAATPASSASAAPRSDAAVLGDLLNAVRNGVPRPQPNQFPTPESVIELVFQKIASRDPTGSLVAFPVVEAYERVTLADYVKYVGVYSAQYPLDDDKYGRLSRAISGYLGDYTRTALKILSEQSDGAVTVKEENMQDFLREFDGKRLKALQVVAIDEVPGAGPLPPNVIDQAMGVTEKAMRKVTLRLEAREVLVDVIVARIDGNWRVLNLYPR